MRLRDHLREQLLVQQEVLLGVELLEAMDAGCLDALLLLAGDVECHLASSIDCILLKEATDSVLFVLELELVLAKGEHIEQVQLEVSLPFSGG